MRARGFFSVTPREPMQMRMDDAPVTAPRVTPRHASHFIRRRWKRGRIPIVVLSAGIVAAASGLSGSGNEVVGQSVEPHSVTLVAGGDSLPGPPPPIQEPRASWYEEIQAMAVHRGTMVAVGQRSARPRDERPDLDQPLAWWSTDNGDHWHAASPPGTGRLTAVAATEDGFLAVGQIVDDLGTRSVVLTSDDGRAWSVEAVPGLTDVMLDAIVLTPRGSILAGFRLSAKGHEPLALIRRASTGWRPTVLPGRVADGHAEIRGGCVAGDDVVLVGRTVAADGTRAPLVVRSSDLGETWRIVPLPGPVLVGPDSRANGSPDRAQKPSEPTTVPVPPARGSGDAMVTSLDPTGEIWLAAHGGRNACELVDPALLGTVLGAEPTIVPVSESAGIGIECRWRPVDGNRFVSIEVTPARRLDTFESTYPFVVTSRQPIPDICQDARYYGAVQAAVARCGDSAVAVGGLAREGATVVLEAVGSYAGFDRPPGGSAWVGA